MSVNPKVLCVFCIYDAESLTLSEDSIKNAAFEMWLYHQILRKVDRVTNNRVLERFNTETELEKYNKTKETRHIIHY